MRDEGEWEKLVALVGSARNVVIVGHVGPDADALGSALGLALALRADGRSATVTVGEPGFSVPRSLTWLPGADTVVRPEEIPHDADALIAVDCAALDRLGTLAGQVDDFGMFAVVDHHASNDGFAQINVVDPSAAATAVLIAQLVDSARLPWAPGVAQNLFAALSSDTGGFRYSNTDVQAWESAIDLVSKGVDSPSISRQLFSSRPWAVVQANSALIAGAELDPAGAGGVGLAIAAVDAETRRTWQVHYDDLDSAISELACIEEAGVVALVKQDDHGRWKVSLRSRGAVDVGRFASSHGGGGHTLAAGYTASSAVLDDVLAELRGHLGDEEYVRR